MLLLASSELGLVWVTGPALTIAALDFCSTAIRPGRTVARELEVEALVGCSVCCWVAGSL